MKYLWIIFLLVLISSCMIEDIPMAGTEHCYWEETEDFNFSLAKWEKSEIKYFIKDYPAGINKPTVQRKIGQAASLWAEHAGIPIVETDNLNNADVVIKVEKLDGLGGTLGRSMFPPHNDFSQYPVPLVLDYYDVATEEGRAAYDFFQSHFMSLVTHSASDTLILKGR